MMRVDIKYHVFNIDKCAAVRSAIHTAIFSFDTYKKGVVGVCIDNSGNITISIANLSNKRTYECINFIDGAARSVGALLERRLVWWMPNGGSVCEEDTSKS